MTHAKSNDAIRDVQPAPHGAATGRRIVPRAYLVHLPVGSRPEPHELTEERRCTLGRSVDNVVVVPDDGCSRHHAEMVFDGAHWVLRDLQSLNGTSVNGHRLDKPTTLTPGDRIRIAQCEFVFLSDPEKLDDWVPTAEPTELIPKTVRLGGTVAGPRYQVRRRQDQTEVLNLTDVAAPTSRRPWTSHNLQALYGLALKMGLSSGAEELAGAVLDALAEATGAENGAILRWNAAGELAPLASRGRPGETYLPLADELRQLLLDDPRGILLDEYPATATGRRAPVSKRSVILTPFRIEPRLGRSPGAAETVSRPPSTIDGILHLYTADGGRPLGPEDLDLALAVSFQLGPVLHGLEQTSTLMGEVRWLKDAVKIDTELVGDSPALATVKRQIELVADSAATVLIRGESGVGKELVASAVHFSSPRRDGPFLCLNCAALPEGLLESELFGHEKGAFTNAIEQRKGKFEVADRGTIFLDEIGELGLATQAKLLRVLDGQPFERVGGTAPIQVNVRVVAATNRDLEAAVEQRQFRSDLYYRLRVIEIHIPPLRDRRQDIPILAQYFLRRLARDVGRRIRGFSSEAMTRLMQYDWPGNVRELKNVVERVVVLSRQDVIRADDLLLGSADVPPPTAPPPPPPIYQPTPLDDIEARHILQTLQYTNWNKSQAAGILGIERSTLDRKIKRYQLREPSAGDGPTH